MLTELHSEIKNAIKQFNADGTLSFESYDALEMWLVAVENENPMELIPSEVKLLTESILNDMDAALTSLATGELSGLSDEDIMEGEGYFAIGDAIYPLWIELCRTQVDHNNTARERTAQTRARVEEALNGMDIDFEDPTSMDNLAEALSSVVNEMIIDDELAGLDAEIENFFNADGNA